MKQPIILFSRRFSSLLLLCRTRHLLLKNTKLATTDLLNWSIGVLGVVGTAYGTWAVRKSKRMRKVEEDGEMLENADKIVSMWEKLSANSVQELRELKGEFKAMSQKYNDLRVEFEVEKRQNGFLIEQYKLQSAQKDLEITRLTEENSKLREQIGSGLIRNIV
jgi:hypothetical protein